MIFKYRYCDMISLNIFGSEPVIRIERRFK